MRLPKLAAKLDLPRSVRYKRPKPPTAAEEHARQIKDLEAQLVAFERTHKIARAREHLLDFTEFTMPDPEAPNDVSRSRYKAAKFHKIIASDIDRFIAGDLRNDDGSVCTQLIFCMPPRHGKACAHDTPVLTPAGWRQHGDLREGDEVFGPDGVPTVVLGVSADVDIVVPVTLSNGDVIRCHPNHEWTVFDRACGEWRTLETRSIASRTLRSGPNGRGGRFALQLPDVAPLQFPEADLPLHPYVLGAWLGDGSCGSTRIAHAPADTEVVDHIRDLGHPVSGYFVQKGTGVAYTVFAGTKIGVGSPMQKALKALGVLRDKHVPEICLRASEEQRLQLLAGLIDTDGHVERRTGRVRFSTCSARLRDGVEDLARSLGFRPYVVSAEPVVTTSRIVSKKIVYQVCFQPTMEIPTRIPRKRIAKFAVRRRIAIVKVGDEEHAPARSISVAREDGLYVVGRTCVATHNTALATKSLAAWYMGRNPSHQVAVATYSDAVANDFGSDTRAIVLSQPYKQVFPAMKLRRGGTAKDNMETVLGGRTVFVGRGGALTGKGAHCFPAGTKVATTAGSLPIESLALAPLSVEVLSYDHSTKRIVAKSAEAFANRTATRLLRVSTTGGRVVVATADHPFFTVDGYKEASELAAGDRLVCLVQERSDTSRIRYPVAEPRVVVQRVPSPASREREVERRWEEDRVLSVDEVPVGEGGVEVYDIQVEGTHCFFADGVLVHNCLLIDDLYKDHEEARSPAIRDQTWNWFTKVAMTRRMGKKLVMITMTRWHSDDIIGRLTDKTNPYYNEAEAKRWKIIRLPAIAEDDDPLFRAPGEALWPDGPDTFDLDFLMSQQRLDPLGFAALYQQRPTVADGILFRRETIQRYDRKDLPEDLRYYAASDHAVGTSQRNDPSCFIKVGVDRHDNVYVIDCIWKRMPTDAAVEAMLTMASGDTRPIVWWAERGHISKSIGPFLMKRAAETGIYLNVREVTPANDKSQRAQSIAARVAMGKVFFPKEEWADRAIEEMLAFPNGTHDDFVDALAYIGLGLQNMFGAKTSKSPVQSSPKFGTLAWVRENDRFAEERKRAASRGGF